MLTQLEGYMSGIELQIALDGVIRQFAAEEWNWRQVQDDIKPFLEIQLLRAQYSSSFHELYRRLERKDLVQGDRKDDVQNNVTLRRQLFSADLDNVAVGRCKDAAESFLATRTSCGIDPRAVVSDSTGRISKSARYIEMLSNGFDLNSAEVPILEEVETLLKRRKPGSLDLEVRP
ncbi:hypothetical protein H072_9102 [Dactylellina haptotyla CBS 200.50]|uniref:Uncharacterized protein n=1 Tax=Dactylellina haptotyla (strain CBS 200.50) TaxID=1284197 RepID=S8A3E5_DACHA|nr:hypothetical protein H072_9102 [Dactylellina haptotyla CBS 200.50]